MKKKERKFFFWNTFFKTQKNNSLEISIEAAILVGLIEGLVVTLKF